MFITFEGIDGSGKTVQARRLFSFLKEQGIDAHLFAEPSDGVIGKKVKRLMGRSAFLKMHPYAIACLFMAERINNFTSTVQPLLDSGATVIMDRFIDSTIAYQGASMLVDNTAGVDFAKDIADEVQGIGRWLVPLASVTLARPDITFLIRLNPKKRIFRIKKRGGKGQFYERRGSLFYWAVNSIYTHLASTNPSRVLVLDGSKPLEVLSGEIIDIWRARTKV